MKEKAASITAQRERKTEAGTNAISTFICHASEELETSLAPELRLPAASPWPGELLGGTRALGPLEGTSWCVATCMRGGGQVPVPQPHSPSPLHQASVLWRFRLSVRHPASLAGCPAVLLSTSPRFRGGSAMLLGAEVKKGDKRGLQHLPPCIGRVKQPFPRLSLFVFQHQQLRSVHTPVRVAICSL